MTKITEDVAMRLYEAVKVMAENRDAIIRTNPDPIKLDKFADAWLNMEETIADAEKPYEPMPSA